MAGRPMRVRHQDDVRAKIQASVIIGYLRDHTAGKREMSPTQIQAAKILLAKSLPDLQSIELTGGDGGPVQTTIVVGFRDPK